MLDYYKILEINRNADQDTIKKAYKTLALKWHPDRNPNNKDEAEKKFKEISEAYECLSNDEEKNFYDKFGKRKTSEQNFKPNANFGRFDAFFGGFPFSDDDVFHHHSRVVKDSDVIHDVQCTINNIYTGVTKKFKIKRKIFSNDSSYTEEEKIFSIEIKPGYKEGTTIKFKESGDVHINRIPADIIFTVKIKNDDENYKREGDDLIITEKIDLNTARTGTLLSITLPDNKVKKIKISPLSFSDDVHIEPNLGFLNRKTGENGNLIIKFRVSLKS